MVGKITPKNLLAIPADFAARIGLPPLFGRFAPSSLQAANPQKDPTRLAGNLQRQCCTNGKRTGGKAGRGSENKIPFVAALSMDHQNHPTFVKFSPVPGFTLTAIAARARDNLSPGGSVISDGLDCFLAVTKAGCSHQAFVVGGKKPKELPEFHGVNTVPGNLKTSLAGTYHAFAFNQYGGRYLAEASCRFNRRFRLDFLPQRLWVAAIGCPPHTETGLRRQAEKSCQSGNRLDTLLINLYDLVLSCEDELYPGATSLPPLMNRKWRQLDLSMCPKLLDHYTN